jgi:ATP-dependent helicase/DNAse subunit B
LHPREFNEFISKQIIEKLNFKKNIIDEYQRYYGNKDKLDFVEKTTYEEAIEKDAKALSKFLEIVNELCYILEDRFPNAEYSLDELIIKLKTAITTAKYQISEKEDFGVNITSIEQTRGIPYKVMILCGAIDGIYPMQYRTDTFLGKELSSSMKRHLNSERLQFYQFLTNDKDNFNKSNKKIYITYPTYQNEEELVRSSFIDALLKITDLEESNNIFNIINIKNDNASNQKKDLLKEIPWLNTTANNRELFEYIGNSIINHLDSDKTNSEISAQDIPFESQRKYINYILNSSKDKFQIDVDKLPDSIQEKILAYKDKAISITDLERYAACPYKFFIINILGLETKEDFDLSMSPLIKGNILHSILYNFYTQLKNEQLDSGNFEYKISSNNPEIPPIIPVILNPNEKRNYIIKLMELANHELEYVRFEHPFYQLDEERILGSSDRISILENWLNFELQRVENNWGFSPVLFEFGFGIGKFSKVDFVEIDGLKIRGKIDRIELYKSGDEYKFLIADYKNKINKKHDDKFIREGLAFQMPLYLLAAKEFLNKEFNLEANSECAVYYSFEPANKDSDLPYHKFNLLEYDSHFAKLYNFTKRSKKTLSEGENPEEILQNSLKTAKSIVDNISKGYFPVEPKNNECQYCKFLSICRFKQRNIFEYFNEEEE